MENNTVLVLLDRFVVSVLNLIPLQHAPLPPPSFTPNSITVILSTTTYLSLRLPASNWFRTLACAVVKAPKSSHITAVLHCLHWLKITERIEYKLLSLTYKVLTTTQPPLTVETLQAEICRRERFLKGGGSLRSPILGGREHCPPTTVGWQKTRRLSFHMV